MQKSFESNLPMRIKRGFLLWLFMGREKEKGESISSKICRAEKSKKSLCVSIVEIVSILFILKVEKNEL